MYFETIIIIIFYGCLNSVSMMDYIKDILRFGNYSKAEIDNMYVLKVKVKDNAVVRKFWT